jgi:hypothetical protein
MTITAAQIHCKTATEASNVSVDFQGYLDAGELITGTPTVTASPAGPSISAIAVSTTALTIGNASVPIGKAVTFHVTGGTAGTRYTLTAAIDTSSAPSQHRELNLILDVV